MHDSLDLMRKHGDVISPIATPKPHRWQRSNSDSSARLRRTPNGESRPIEERWRVNTTQDVAEEAECKGAGERDCQNITTII